MARSIRYFEIPAFVVKPLPMSGRQHQIPPIDLLRANHQFPGPFTFKVIGTHVDQFVERTVRAAQLELGSLDVPEHRTRIAEGGRHIAVTLEIYVESAEQVLALYARFKDLEGLVILL